LSRGAFHCTLLLCDRRLDRFAAGSFSADAFFLAGQRFHTHYANEIFFSKYRAP